MTVELVTTSSPEIVEAMERLIPQLSRSAPALTAEQCEALIAQEGVFLFVFRPEAEAGQSAPILGMLTLATFTIPTGLRAWVEDVVVDGEARGQGAGQALVEAGPLTAPVPPVRPPWVPTLRQKLQKRRGSGSFLKIRSK